VAGLTAPASAPVPAPVPAQRRAAARAAQAQTRTLVSRAQLNRPRSKLIYRVVLGGMAEVAHARCWPSSLRTR